MSRSRRIHDLVAGTAAAAGLLGLVVGVPIALTAAVGWPLGRLPATETLVTALRYGQIAPSTILKMLAVVVWTAWALSVASIALEAIAVARGTVARALPGMGTLQTAAAHLVATMMLLSSMSTRAVALPAAALTSTAPAAVLAQAPAAPVPAAAHERDAAPARDRRPSDGGDGPSWTVQRRDSLWSIAERSLGDGRRWKEIAALNEDRAQPDGRRLRPGDTVIHPGWRLVLPSDARTPTRPARITVADGDTLWSVAAEHLDDGHRWRQVYARNRGRRQADGGRLTDPDRIRPGWVLRLPTEPRNTTGGRHPDGATASDRSSPSDDALDRQAPATPPAADDPPAAPLAWPPADDDPADHPPAASTTPRAADHPPVTLPVTPRTLSGGPTRGRSGIAPRPHVAPPMQPASQRAPTGAPGVRSALLGGAALLAVGLVGLLARRRRHWLRRREFGAVLAPVDAEAVELERWLRSMTEHDLRERMDRVLRMLTEHFAEHDITPVVRAIELGEQVTLRLGEPLPEPPPGVTSNDDGSRWTLAPELETGPAAARWYVPALASCGRLPSGALLLVNPLATDVLGVSGPPGQTADALTSWTAELATGGAARGVDVVVVGSHHPLLERLPRVTVAADTAQALDRVRRVTDDRGGFATHVVVICGAVAHGEALDALVGAARHPRAGIVVAGHRTATVCVEIAGAHTRLTPDGDWIDAPEWLTPLQWDRFGDLLRQPGNDHVPHPVPTAVLSVSTLASGEAVTDVPLNLDDGGLTEVGVLGPLTIDGRLSTLHADAASVVTYLGTHLTGADPTTIAAVLWPAHPDREERRERAFEAVEEALGGTDDQPVLVHTDDGRVELCSAVTTDLRAFHELLHGLEQLPVAAQGGRLYAALQLVRGEPFASGADWAHTDGLATGTAGLVTDVAHRLAMQALSVGDVDRAAWAVDRGLRATPGCELLYRDRMRIADARGDLVALDACMRELRAQVEDDDGWVTPATVEFYEQLRGGTAPTPPELREDAS